MHCYHAIIDYFPCQHPFILEEKVPSYNIDLEIRSLVQ